MALGAEQVLFLDSGATYRIGGVWEEQDLWGYTGEFVVYRGTELVEEGTVLFGPPHEFEFGLTADQTSGLVGIYTYTLTFTNAADDKQRILFGKLLVRGT